MKLILDRLLAIVLIVAGVIRILNAFIFKAYQGWGWVLFSGILTLLTGIIILMSPDALFWVRSIPCSRYFISGHQLSHFSFLYQT